MKKFTLLLFSLVVIIAVAAGCNKSNSDSNSNGYDNSDSTVQKSNNAAMNENMATNQNFDDSDTSTAPVSTNAVTIQNYAYGPAIITIKKGTTVTWINQDNIKHNVVADTASAMAPAGPLLAKGETYSFKFDTVGTYAYHCGPHPYMKGTVIVTE